MQLILTHEQADFDALGAVLSAYLLNDQAIPVLPRRINRNGRAFLVLYGAELPFVDPRDLPSEPIESILLVDTQSLITLKGMGAQQTPVRVIDHHRQRSDAPSYWQISIDQTGACTTLLVEALQEHTGHSLTIIQATLLLLGIYEDTGSLTYANTTGRDARAAAYLLEQGASLAILAEYLNPPLSPEQRSIYDRLLYAAKTHTIHGHSIVIACTDAEGMTDEISSVAHKLRDLLDPDALFLLISTNEGIRLVARATTDQINVAAITAAFGGGGHERAAAALIHNEDDLPDEGNLAKLEKVQQDLLQLLPRHILPSITANQIMSRQPLLISPTTSVHVAAQLMQRYGYEGYPVVNEGGQVVGLLTRRAVDRAIAHKLNLNAASLMEAGQVTIAPGDSIEHIQHVMTSSGWGQLPVVDPNNEKVIGIVTRTDLLKTLSPKSRHPSTHNLADKLEAVLPPARLALLKVVVAQAHTNHSAAYIVGGFVRDLLLDRPSLDFDIVIEGDAITLGRALVSRLGGRVVTHRRFGTAKWRIADVKTSITAQLADLYPPLDGKNLQAADLPESLDLIGARTEFYDRPTALPTVERSGIKLDLHRRDFTINTLALQLDGRHYGELHDYWGGMNDLHRRLVRVLHSLSFIDDPTRLLRAVRFEQRFGFNIEKRTLELMKEALPLLKQVSGERLHHELDLILAEDKVGATLTRLDSLDILEAIHPGLVWNDQFQAVITGFKSRFPDQQSFPTLVEEWGIPPRVSGVPSHLALMWIVWLCRLPETDLSNIGQRLKLHGGLVDALLRASYLMHDLPNLALALPSKIVERLDNVPLLAIFAVYWLVDDKNVCSLLEQYATKWRHIMPNTNGNTLLEYGLPPSAAYRSILKTLRDAWLNEQIHTLEEEKSLLAALIQSFAHGKDNLAVEN